MIYTKTGWSVFREFKASRHDLESLNMMALLPSDVWMIFRAMNSPQASAVKIELWSGFVCLFVGLV